MIDFRLSFSTSVTSVVGVPTEHNSRTGISSVVGVFTKQSSTTGIRSILLLVAFLLATVGFGQKPNAAKKILQRCGTMEAIAKDMENDPALRERIQQGQLDYQHSLTSKPNTALGNIINRPAN
jgi:2,4-dienoyl-CoA reductase-like NADH-dependent reductase (Old Yellow Enzyme family)